MILDHQVIRYKIEDDVDDKIANLKIDDLEVQEPANYSTSHSSYKPLLPHHEQHVERQKAKEPTVVKLQQIDQMTYSVKFPYNHLVLTFVKSIEGRYWVNEQKAWHIPHESIDELLYKLKKYNIAFEIQQL